MSSCERFPMSQDQIRAWVRRHPEALPQTVDDLGRFPMAFRRVMVAMVAPEVRLRLRREHLETFLAPESPLTSDQRTFVVTTIPELPKLFGAPAPNPVIVEWERRMATVFPRERASRVFGELGPSEPPEGIPIPPDSPARPWPAPLVR